LIFIHRLAIDLRTVSAPFISQCVVAIAHVDDGGVQARNGQVLKEDIAFATASNAERFFANFIDAARLFAFFDANDACTILGLRACIT